jgi:hypothetical protein
MTPLEAVEQLGGIALEWVPKSSNETGQIIELMYFLKATILNLSPEPKRPREYYQYKFVNVPGSDTDTDNDLEMEKEINRLALDGYRLLPVVLHNMSTNAGIMEVLKCTPVEVV